MSPVIVLTFLAGLVLLIGGAELLVRGASRLAITVGISPLVIGLTVVAYGTSAPEVAVTLQAVFATPARPDLAIGNVVGSNIANILLVLGISAVVAPLIVSRSLVKWLLPFMIAVSILVWGFGSDGQISRTEGAMLFAGALLFSVFSVARSRLASHALNQRLGNQPRPKLTIRQVGLDLLLIVMGLFMLVLGAHWLVEGAVVVAKLLKVSELVIGLTVVAVGTSLPEIATSVVASIRGQRDIAVGNVIGSNIFNILLVLGLSAILAPQPLVVSAAATRFDIPIMCIVALACWPILFTGWTISRWEGAALLTYYLAYTLFLYLQTTKHAALDNYLFVMLYFALPLTGVVLVILASRFWHRRNGTLPATADHV